MVQVTQSPNFPEQAQCTLDAGSFVAVWNLASTAALQLEDSMGSIPMGGFMRAAL
jgi:hypothetical protein